MQEKPENSPAGTWKSVGLWFVLSVIVWIFCFHGFLSGQRSFDSDAVAYYDSIKFFSDNLVRGVYPMWDWFESSGVPNEFFLRRIGSFNPFFIIIVLLRWIGVPHLYAYVTFLATYWFVGLLGFWWLAQQLFRDIRVSYLAYLLLAFSTLATRLFDSYIVLTFVPLIWFFAFLVACGRHPRRRFYAGLVLSLLQLVTTYIPLYFLNIFLVGAVLFLMVFPDRIVKIVTRQWQFIRQAKGFSVLLVCLVGLSLLPAIGVFQSAKQGEFVMPMRGAAAESDHALQVGKSTITEWAILEEIVYSMAYSDLRQFKFAVIFIPGIAYFLLSLGVFARINRLLIFLFLWGGVLTVIGMPDLAPLYDWCHRHIFYFKYFRNLHWFFWLAILPLFVLFIVGQLQQMMDEACRSGGRRRFWMMYAAAVVMLGGWMLIQSGETLISTYIAFGICIAWLGLFFSGHLDGRIQLTMALLFLAVSIQSVEVYSYLKKNSVKHTKPYRYDLVDLDFAFTRDEPISDERAGIYYALSHYNELNSNIQPRVLGAYRQHSFMVYDQAVYMDPGAPNYADIEKAMATRANIVFVDSADHDQVSRTAGRIQGQVRPITAEDYQLEVLDYSTNRTRVRTNFSADKWLVYTDNFAKQWSARIDGQRHPLVRANHAFKAVFVPAGERIVEFQYGKWSKRLLNYTLLLVAYGLLAYVLLQACRRLDGMADVEERYES